MYDEINHYDGKLFKARIDGKWGLMDLNGIPVTIKKRGLKKITDVMSNAEKIKLVFDCP